MDKILNDRLVRGFIAGLLAGFLGALVWNLLSRYILDFAAGFIFRKAIGNIWEAIFAFFIVKLFFALLGIIFAFLIIIINPNLLIFKGWLYGVALWFTIYSMIAIFKIPILIKVSPQTCCSHFIKASIWGVWLGYFLNLFNKKSESVP